MGLLTDRVALVTGSSRGIGAAIASLFSKEGAKVAVHGRDAAAVASILGSIESGGGCAMSVLGDVTRLSDLERMRARIEEELGPIDVLVVNAGGSTLKPRPLEEMSEEEWRAEVDSNLTATFATLKSFLPGMKRRRRGSIIVISSAAARRADARSPIAYAAAKAGIQMLALDVAAQAGPFQVRVNCIAPETILTERNRERIPREIQASLAEAHPLKRLGTAEDVAEAALFLASDRAAWITGVILDVAGGAVMAR